MNPRKANRTIEPLSTAAEPEIGRALWAFENTRSRTLRSLENLPPDALDAQPPVGDNTIGTLLYHIAEAEAWWIYEIILEYAAYPPEIAALFPYKDRDEQEILTGLRGHSLDTYLHRLSFVREKVLEVYNKMRLEEFRQVHIREDNMEQLSVSAEWVLHHLMQHEAEHRGHIQVIVESVGKKE